VTGIRGWLRELSWQGVHWAWEQGQRSGAVTAGTPAGRRFAAFGPGSIAAFPTGTFFGERWITVGSDTLIGAFVSLTAGLVPVFVDMLPGTYNLDPDKVAAAITLASMETNTLMAFTWPRPWP